MFSVLAEESDHDDAPASAAVAAVAAVVKKKKKKNGKKVGAPGGASFANEVDSKESASIKKKKKSNAGEAAPAHAVASVGSKDVKYEMTAQQKEILRERRQAQLDQKAAKQAAKELLNRCHFFAACGKPKEGDYSYCRSCYNTNTKECALCQEPTFLTSEPGVWHERCPPCRATV